MKDPRANILPPTLLLALSALLSRLLGVVRDHLLAGTFGATAGEGIYNLDTYYAAFRIPDLLYNLLIFGAVSAAFIPIFTQYKKEGRVSEGWAFASSMLHLMFLGILVIAGVAYLFAPQLAHAVAGGFAAQDFEITVRLMRIMLISPILFSVSAVFISIQDSFRHFFYRSLAPLFYNVGIIFGIVYFGKEFGVTGVTWGVVIGAALQLLVQIPALRQVRYKHVWTLGRGREDVKKAFKLMGPRVLGLSMNQITLMLNTLIASFLMTGSITIFYLADNLQALPLGLIGISFAITSFATLSEMASEPGTEKFAVEIKRVTRQILFFIIPATAGMLLLRHEIVDVILVSGKFSATDAILTEHVLSILLFSLFAQSLIPLLSRGFYAFHNTKTPVVTGLIGSAVAIAGSLFFGIYLEWGILGIAAAWSLGNVLNFALLALAMTRKLKCAIVDFWNLFKIIFASVLMYLSAGMVQYYFPFEGDLLQKIGLLVLPTAVGAGVYFGLAYLLKISGWRTKRF